MLKHPSTADRAALLEQMGQLTSMERGTLSEEYRERPDGAGGTERLGPYFKHQVWEAGANRSRRVPVEEVPALRQDLENHQRFTALADALVEQTVQETRARRAEAKAGADPEAKKNSRPKARTKAFAKPKPSSS
jgi:mannitol-1-phosphate/altronate dehydrogenase